MEIVRWVGFAVGIMIVLGTVGSMISTLVVPRGVPSRLSVFVSRTLVRKTMLFIAGRFESYEAKDRILAFAGPISLLALLVTWLTTLLIGFSLILWPLTGGTLARSFEEAGSSMFTLGIASVPRLGPSIVYFSAAASGLFVVALQIAYLPTIYGAFNRRESLVTMLQSRAGSPAWGPEIVARHQLVGILDNLPQFYADWEEWAANVAESHTTYPVLIWFRSPHALRSWLIGLLAVLDSAALYLAFNPSNAPSEARLCLRMGFTCLRDIASNLGMLFDPDPFPEDPIQLSFEEFLGGVHRLEEAGYPMEKTAEEAWLDFKGWRVNYESIVYALADVIVAPPGPWSGPRTRLPDMNFVPQRPADRRPKDPKGHEPKVVEPAARAGMD